MVGDENQSIYRFRNADLEVFREQRRRARDVGRQPGAAAARQLPLAAACAGRGQQIGATLLGEFTPLTAGREAEEAPGDRAAADARQERGRSGAEVGCRGDRPGSGAERLAAANHRRGQAPGGETARSRRCRRRRTRRDRRSAARLYPCRCLRAGALPGRPAAVRRRRSRLLDPTAGRGSDPSARRRLESARRRVPVRSAGFVRGRRQPRRSVAAAPRGQQRRGSSAPCLAGARVALRRRPRAWPRRTALARGDPGR